MRKKLVVGNWKMNLTQAEALSVVESLLPKIASFDSVDVAVCPSYLCIPKVREAVKRSSLHVGAQDAFWVDSGAFTGRVSSHMLADAGVEFCIVGHSETRGRFGKMETDPNTSTYFSESNLTINLKLKSLLYHNITPILCVGETLAEREAEATDGVISDQLNGALTGILGEEFREAVVAYEPVWAIGTGKTCDSEEASRVCGHIRSRLSELFGHDTGGEIRVLYGGSVKASNAGELFKRPDIDGGLVGGASLDPEEFCKIVMSAA
ncbi:MAG TPA: triose-phosphate isomerase [Fimbriimonas sp.]|nr:triose-phosphate isomerase [Fimbriimonas sp.]